MTEADALRITDWALEDRPREKLMAQGPAALSNAVIFAFLGGAAGLSRLSKQASKYRK